MNRTFQSGASMTEFIIAMPVFVLLIFVIAELALMYQAKSIVDMAALAAARTGAINGADASSMENAAAIALTPLYTHGTGKLDPSIGSGKSMLDSKMPAVYGHEWSDMLGYSPDFGKVVRIKILSPTRAIAKRFAVKRAGNEVVPNDNLMYRQTTEYSNVNIQDVNLLKIKLTYLYETKMPLTQYFFAPFVDANLTRTLFTSDIPHGQRAPSPTLKVGGLEIGDGRVPLVSYATVRMQSDAKVSNLPGP
jgi:hypothetical protein